MEQVSTLCNWFAKTPENPFSPMPRIQNSAEFSKAAEPGFSQMAYQRARTSRLSRGMENSRSDSHSASPPNSQRIRT